MSTAVTTRTAVAMRSPSDLFFEQLSRAGERLLLLDYDGTIAPFSVHRNRAFPYASVPELLDCIMSTCRTRVLLISGRLAREIPPLLGLNPHPEIWGTYGIERLHADGSYQLADIGDHAQNALCDAEAALRQQGLDGATERKPGAIAVHWRGLNPPQIEDIRARAYRSLSPVALQTGLMLAEFEGGLEVRARSCSKGDTVRSILSDMAATVPVAYLGDDTTDEDAFRALNGRGLTVLVRPTCRFTAAQMWIRPPEELIHFLTNWIQACGGDM
jgi:trehalose 6-phosphate phosphatase